MEEEEEKGSIRETDGGELELGCVKRILGAEREEWEEEEQGKLG